MGKNYIFKDNIGLSIQNIHLKNYPLLLYNLSNPTTWRGDMGQKLHFSRQHRAGGTRNICLKKNQTLLSQNFFKSNYLERRYGSKTTFFITIVDPL